MADRHILYKLQPAIDGQRIADAGDVEVSDTDLTGVITNSGDVQEALKRIDNTGLGAQVREFTGSFFANYSAGSDNTNTWYGGRQTVSLRGEAASNGQYTFRMPDFDDVTAMFDDLAARGVGEVYTLTIEYAGGTTGFVNRNRLTITNASVSNGFVAGTFPTVLAQGQSATFRISRVGGTTGSWERLAFVQAVDPVPTLGEVVLQSTGWNNADNSFLPSGSSVIQGYAFPVLGSNPNDGTLRQGLLDAGVTDRLIYDGDYVIWTAASFTSWTNNNGADWFVLPRNQLQSMSREESNFLSQVTEIDNRVDVGPVSVMTNDALVWLSENPFATAPFLTPSTDTNNPRSGDDYAYIGGRENRDFMNRFQFGQNRFNSYLTLGVTPNFITAHPESTIDIVIRDIDNQEIARFNLEDDFTFRNDGDFTNSTVRHYTRNTSFNYAFLTTVDIVLTQVQRHFRLDQNAVDTTQNVKSLSESQLDQALIDKINAPLPDDSARFREIEPRLMRYANVTHTTPEVNARFLDSTGSDTLPSGLTGFTQVSPENPRFTGGNVALYVAVPAQGAHILRNINTSSDLALADSEATVDALESLSVDGTTYFVYRITGLTSGHVYEVETATIEQVVQERNDIQALKGQVERIDSELEHAALNLPDELVQVLDNEVTVTEESNPVIVATEYNNQLAGATNTTQTVFYEPDANAGSGGTLNSRPFNLLAGDQVRRKLVYINPQTLFNQNYLTAFDGSTGRDLISYAQGDFFAKVFVPAIPAGSTTTTIYPAPATRISGAGIWQTIDALTFQNGVPVTEADELFFTRNLPTSTTTLTIQYRGHANGNLFGANTITLANVGGAQDAITSFSINDGSETAFVEVFYRAAHRDIRVSVTERVNAGLPTINDIQVILSYDETRTVPATPATTRDVFLESATGQTHVFAIKPSSTNTLVIVGSEAEVDTGYTYTTLFGASETGNLILATENGIYFNYEDFDPISGTVVDLINHASLPQYGLFSTEYTHETVVSLGTQLVVLDSSGATRNVGDVLSDLLTRVSDLE